MKIMNDHSACWEILDNTGHASLAPFQSAITLEYKFRNDFSNPKMNLFQINQICGCDIDVQVQFCTSTFLGAEKQSIDTQPNLPSGEKTYGLSAVLLDLRNKTVAFFSLCKAVGFAVFADHSKSLHTQSTSHTEDLPCLSLSEKRLHINSGKNSYFGTEHLGFSSALLNCDFGQFSFNTSVFSCNTEVSQSMFSRPAASILWDVQCHVPYPRFTEPESPKMHPSHLHPQG